MCVCVCETNHNVCICEFVYVYVCDVCIFLSSVYDVCGYVLRSMCKGRMKSFI